MIPIEKPSDVELSVLMLQHAHRRPEKAKFLVPDGEAFVELPLLLGNPSGACKMPDGQPVSSSWDDVISATFGLLRGVESDTEQLVADCVLWPDAGTWGAWAQRWPALPNVIQAALRGKIGSSMKLLEEKPAGDKPAGISAMLIRHPSAAWRQLKANNGDVFDVAIGAPDSGLWKMFVAAMKKPGENHAQLARDMAASCVILCTDAKGDAVSADVLFDQYPGYVLLVGLSVMYLAGVGSSFTMGEW